jgi:hypothetical protein
MRTTTGRFQAEQLWDAADLPRQHLPELFPLPGDGPRSMDQVSADGLTLSFDWKTVQATTRNL